MLSDEEIGKIAKEVSNILMPSIREMEKRMEYHIGRTDALFQRIDGVEKRIDGVEKRMDDRIDGVVRRLDEMSHTLNTLMIRFDILYNALRDIPEKYARKEEVEELKKKAAS